MPVFIAKSPISILIDDLTASQPGRLKRVHLSQNVETGNEKKARDEFWEDIACAPSFDYFTLICNKTEVYPVPNTIPNRYTLSQKGGEVDVRRVVAIAIPFAFYATFVKIPIYL